MIARQHLGKVAPRQDAFSSCHHSKAVGLLEGGHHVPDDIIRPRYHASWHNFQHLYQDLLDEWEVREIPEERQ